MSAKKRANLKTNSQGASGEDQIITAIKGRLVIKFIYNGAIRIVEPQTYGLSTAGRPVLRGYQVAGESSRGPVRGLRLYEVSKISDLARTDTRFPRARPEHRPDDSAMSQVVATLPSPKSV